MASKLTQAHLGDLRDVFSSLDTGRTGTIGVSELKTVLHAIGHQATEAEVQDIVHEVDRDGTSRLDFDEFVHFMTTKLDDRDADAEYRLAFRTLDGDGDGQLSLQDLCQSVPALDSALSNAEILEMLMEADRRGKGAISFDDFMHAMRS